MFSLGKSRFTVRIYSHVIVNNLVIVDFEFPVIMMMRSIVFDFLPEPNPRKDPTIDS
jgi:hypothetical protein